MDKNQIERIKEMESCLDETGAAIRELSQALSRYEEIRDKYCKLEEYYGSAEWKEDFKADEEGKLPHDLKRGVLSEDAIYDLIDEHRELVNRLEKLAHSR